jgi:hypothetical protein
MGGAKRYPSYDVQVSMGIAALHPSHSCVFAATPHSITEISRLPPHGPSAGCDEAHVPPPLRRRSASFEALATLIERAPRSAPTNRLSDVNACASLQRTGPAPRGGGVARLLSDCHAAAVEAREGEAVEGLAEGSALVPQHADSHFLAERH